MKTGKHLNPLTTASQEVSRSLSSMTGSVLVYLIVVILIFGLLGVTMVSLFTPATTISATPNHAKQACFMAESASRYAFSELRNNDFAEDTIKDLNSTTYNVTDAGSFSIRAFGLWFESPSNRSASPYTLNISRGELPLDFSVPANPSNPKVWAVNFEYLGLNISSVEMITAYARIHDATLTIEANNLNIAAGERVGLAVQPSHSHNVTENGDLYVEHDAKDFFPQCNGAININRVDYAYERLVDEPANNRVKLTNLDTISGAFPGTVSVTKNTIDEHESDFIVLSPMNTWWFQPTYPTRHLAEMIINRE